MDSKLRRFNGFVHYHGNVTRQARKFLRYFLFFPLSTALVTAFLNLDMYLELELCLFKSDLLLHSLWHTCTKIKLPSPAEVHSSKQYSLKKNTLIL